jgi:hypothetical protein
LLREKRGRAQQHNKTTIITARELFASHDICGSSMVGSAMALRRRWVQWLQHGGGGKLGGMTTWGQHGIGGVAMSAALGGGGGGSGGGIAS